MSKLMPVDCEERNCMGSFKIRKFRDRWIAVAAFVKAPRRERSDILMADFEFRTDAAAWVERMKGMR